MTTNLFPSLLASILLAGVSPALRAQEQVRLRNGNTEQGRIESEDYDALKIKVKKGKDDQTMSIPWADVAEVGYTGELQKAINQIASGNRTQAVQALQAQLGGTTLRKELRPAAQFQLASAQMRDGQWGDAATTLQDLLKNNPKSRYLFPAARALAEIHLATQKYDEGATAIDAAANAAKDAGVSVNHLMAFDYFRGLLNEGKKDYVKGKVNYQTASRAEMAQYAELAKLGLARIAEASGQAEEARTGFQALIDQSKNNEVLAGAWNGRAKLTMAEAQKDKKSETALNALFMYLRGVTEYAPLPGEGTGEYERALAGAAEAFKLLADFDTDEAQKKQNAQRARARLDQLRKEFPNSIHLPK